MIASVSLTSTKRIKQFSFSIILSVFFGVMCHLSAPVFFAALTEFLSELTLFASFIVFLWQIVVIWLKLFLLPILSV